MRSFTARLGSARLGSARLGSARLGQIVAPYCRHVKLRLVNFIGKLLPKRGHIMPSFRLFLRINERR